VNIGTAKAVNRLLGVTNHEDTGFGPVFGKRINAIDNSILDRISVLKLINKCHRKALA
jgi:hypothetical protein